MNHDDLLKAAEPARHGGTSASDLAQVPVFPANVENWVRRVNDRWLVHSNLNVDARNYLNHLATTDPDRLARTCGIVQRLMAAHDPLEDPKPPFYGGTFSLVTPDEETTFLADHRFTRLLLPSTPDVKLQAEAKDLELSPEVCRRLKTIRSQIRASVSALDVVPG